MSINYILDIFQYKDQWGQKRPNGVITRENTHLMMQTILVTLQRPTLSENYIGRNSQGGGEGGGGYSYNLPVAHGLYDQFSVILVATLLSEGLLVF